MNEGLEENMVLLMQQSNTQALNKVYDKYAPLLFGVITRIVGNKKVAEDVLQLCFIEIWENKKTYNALKERLFTWMCRIARKSALDFVNKTNTTDNYVSADESENNNKDFNLQQDEREALNLVFLRGFTLNEAAGRLNVSIDHFKQLVVTATKRLKEIAVV